MSILEVRTTAWVLDDAHEVHKRRTCCHNGHCQTVTGNSWSSWC